LIAFGLGGRPAGIHPTPTRENRAPNFDGGQGKLAHIYRIDQDDQPRNGLYETTVYEAQPPVMPRAHKLVG
jgi:hypothetical protein